MLRRVLESDHMISMNIYCIHGCLRYVLPIYWIYCDSCDSFLRAFYNIIAATYFIPKIVELIITLSFPSVFSFSATPIIHVEFGSFVDQFPQLYVISVL